MVSSGTGSRSQSCSWRQPLESAGLDSLSRAGGGPRCAAATTAWSPVDTCNVCCKLAQTEFRPTRLRLQTAGVGLNGKAQEARSRRTWRRMTRGQALVELAIICPSARAGVGRDRPGPHLFARITVANSAREGAYEASYGGSYVAQRGLQRVQLGDVRHRQRVPGLADGRAGRRRVVVLTAGAADPGPMATSSPSRSRVISTC